MIKNKKLFRELRCRNCRKFIIWEYIFAGRTYFKCPRCGEENYDEFRHLRTKDNKDTLKEFEVPEKIGDKPDKVTISK